MLYIRPIMNSAIEEIFSFKTCCSLMKMFDQNLEIHIRNLGERPVILTGYFDLVAGDTTARIDTLTPAGEQRLEPGEIKAFYCYMNDEQWKKSYEIVFYDTEGISYPVALRHESDTDPYLPKSS